MVTMRTQTFFLFLDWLILHSIGLISRDDGDDAHANFFLFQKKSTRPKSKRAQVVQRCAAWAWLLHDADWSARIGTSTLRRAECPRKDKLYPSRLRRKDAPAAIINLRCSHVAAICDLGNLSGSRPCPCCSHLRFRQFVWEQAMPRAVSQPCRLGDLPVHDRLGLMSCRTRPEMARTS